MQPKVINIVKPVKIWKSRKVHFIKDHLLTAISVLQAKSVPLLFRQMHQESHQPPILSVLANGKPPASYPFCASQWKATSKLSFLC